MKELERRLRNLDGKGYGAYKSLAGRHGILSIDKVQPDPYAPPSLIRVFSPWSPPAGLHPVAVTDFLARRLGAAIHRQGTRDLSCDIPGQQVLDRATVVLTDNGVEFRLEAALPARGRRILGHAAARLLTQTLPEVIEDTLDLNSTELHKASDLYYDQEALREMLPKANLCAFIADDSILARRSGDSDLPLNSATRWASPSSLQVFFDLPSGRRVIGTGIPTGVTVVTGGGFHGKSTLLNALKLGVYNHTSGDGREFALTEDSAAAIRAEDGRAVTNVDISEFINNLPNGTDTTRFSTTNASGSTSQAAWLIEALAAGASTLLIDEDTSATNFMIRDERMRALVPSEPITPLIDRVRALYDDLSVSTIIVTGGSSAFLDVADTVILMDHYHAHDITADARTHPLPLQPTFAPVKRASTKIRIDDRIQAKGLHHIRIGRHEDLDLSALQQLVDPSQTRAIAQALSGHRAPRAHPGRLAEVRELEIAFAINHLRNNPSVR